MTTAEWDTRVKRQILAGWVLRNGETIDDAAYFRLLKPYDTPDIERALGDMVGVLRFTPKATEIVAAIRPACPGTPDLDEQWRAFLTDRLPARLPASTIAMWLEPLHPHQLDDAGWVIAGDPLLTGWVRARLSARLAEAAGVSVSVVECEGRQV